MRLGPSLLGAVVGAAVGVAGQVGLETMMRAEAIWFALVVGGLTGFGARAMAGEFIKSTSYVRAALAAVVALAAIFGASYAASEMSRRQNMAAYEADARPGASRPAADMAGDDDGAAEDETAQQSADAATDDQAPPEDQPAEDGAEPSADEATADDVAADETEVDATRNGDAAEDSTAGQPAADETADEAAADATGAADDSGARDALAQVNQEPIPPVKVPLSPWHFAFFAIGTFLAYELARGGDGERSAPPKEAPPQEPSPPAN